MDYIEIGLRIKKFRKLRKLSQEQLAEKVNISPTHMSHIETGATKLSLQVLVDLALTLNTTTDSLLFDIKQPSKQELANTIMQSDERYLAFLAKIIEGMKILV